MKKKFNSDHLKLGVLTAVIAVAMPEMVFAQSVKEMMKEVGEEQLTSMPYVISAAGYVIGSILILSGALSLKKHSENPASEPLGKGLGRLIVGALITALPALLGLIQTSTAFDKAGPGASFTALKITQ